MCSGFVVATDQGPRQGSEPATLKLLAHAIRHQSNVPREDCGAKDLVGMFLLVAAKPDPHNFVVKQALDCVYSHPPLQF